MFHGQIGENPLLSERKLGLLLVSAFFFTRPSQKLVPSTQLEPLFRITIGKAIFLKSFVLINWKLQFLLGYSRKYPHPPYGRHLIGYLKFSGFPGRTTAVFAGFQSLLIQNIKEFQNFAKIWMVFLEFRLKFIKFWGNLWISSHTHWAFLTGFPMSSIGGGVDIFWNSPLAIVYVNRLFSIRFFWQKVNEKHLLIEWLPWQNKGYLINFTFWDIQEWSFSSWLDTPSNPPPPPPWYPMWVPKPWVMEIDWLMEIDIHLEYSNTKTILTLALGLHLQSVRVFRVVLLWIS